MFKSYNIGHSTEAIVIEAMQIKPPAFAQSEDVEDSDIIMEETPEDLLNAARNEARLIMERASKEAGEIIALAKDEAIRLEENLRKQLDKEREQTLKQAHEEGHSKGYDEGKAASQALIDEANRLKQETLDERAAAVERFEGEVMEFITEAVEKLTSTTIRPQLIVALIKQGLGKVSWQGTKEVVLKVSKEDHAHVLGHRLEIERHIEGGAVLEIIKDFSLNPNDCLLETPFGVIDSSLSMQMEGLLQDLRILFGG